MLRMIMSNASNEIVKVLHFDTELSDVQTLARELLDEMPDKWAIRIYDCDGENEPSKSLLNEYIKAAV
jgi:hypothetical protein